MAWEWVGPTATAVVGLAGIASTLTVSARSQEAQRRALDEQWGRERGVARRAERKAAYSAFIAEATAINEAALATLMAGHLEVQSVDPMSRYNDPEHVKEDVASSQRRLASTLGPDHGISDEAIAAVLNSADIRRSVIRSMSDQIYDSILLDPSQARERHDLMARLAADVRLVGAPEVIELTNRVVRTARMLLTGFMTNASQGRGLEPEAEQLGKLLLRLDAAMARDLNN